MPATKNTDATRVIEEAVSATQEQVIGAIEQGQALMLKGYETIVDAVDKLEMPSVPGLNEVYKVRAEAFDSLFDLSSAVLESQRAFTRKVLEVAAKAQS